MQLVHAVFLFTFQFSAIVDERMIVFELINNLENYIVETTYYIVLHVKDKVQIPSEAVVKWSLVSINRCLKQ
jgi:hypothetical protein